MRSQRLPYGAPRAASQGSGRPNAAQRARMGPSFPTEVGAERLSAATCEEVLKARGLFAIQVRMPMELHAARYLHRRPGSRVRWLIVRRRDLAGMWMANDRDVAAGVASMLRYVRRHGTAKLRLFSTRRWLDETGAPFPWCRV